MKKYPGGIILAAGFIFVFSLPFFIYAAGIDAELEKAKQYFERGDYEAAIKVSAGALREEPDNQELISLINQARTRLEEEKKRLQEEKIARKKALLNNQAQACYDKGELNNAIEIWSEILKDDPGNDEAVWMIQKAQARLEIEEKGAKVADLKQRSYSEKIKNIADDITKLIEQAKDKIKEEEGRRKEEELAALATQAKEQEQALKEERQRAQNKEEVFISDTFKRGQEFYAQGKYSDALREWNSILPLLSRDNELRATVESLSSAVRQKINLPADVNATASEAPAMQEKKDGQPERQEILTSPKEGAKVIEEPGRKKSILITVILLLVLGLALVLFIGILYLRKTKYALRPKAIGKDFDPSKLKDFIRKKKGALRGPEKDIFKPE